jgi:hypothetical protein
MAHEPGVAAMTGAIWFFKGLAAPLGLLAGMVGAVASGWAQDRKPESARPAAAQAPQAAPTEEPAASRDAPTFTRDVAPILQKRCQNCHRRDHVGPFALETYEQARKRAADIAAVVEGRLMPPWKPEPGIGPKLKHDQSLTEREIAVLIDWSERGTPRGDAAQMPPPPVFAEGWPLGTPDIILEAAEEFAIPATGPDLYRCFVLPTNFARDTFVSAIDFQPENPRVVHHLTAFLDYSGHARKRDEAEAGPGYTSYTGPGIPNFDMLGFWAAGHQPVQLPEGIGLRMPRQADVVLQVHYHPTGKPETDRTRVGLYLSRTPVKQALHWNAAQNVDFRLPPGKSNVEVKASWYVPLDLEALAVAPHMHMLGRDMRMTLTTPDGRTRDLIHIPDWDPVWQSTYHFQTPVSLPAGSTVRVIAHFDNSERPGNPNQPPKLVKWGHSVEDEMCDGFIAVVKKGQDLTQPRAIDDLPLIFAKQRLRNFRKQLAKDGR